MPKNFKGVVKTCDAFLRCPNFPAPPQCHRSATGMPSRDVCKCMQMRSPTHREGHRRKCDHGITDVIMLAMFQVVGIKAMWKSWRRLPRIYTLWRRGRRPRSSAYATRNLSSTDRYTDDIRATKSSNTAMVLLLPQPQNCFGC